MLLAPLSLTSFRVVVAGAGELEDLLVAGRFLAEVAGGVAALRFLLTGCDFFFELDGPSRD